MAEGKEREIDRQRQAETENKPWLCYYLTILYSVERYLKKYWL